MKTTLLVMALNEIDGMKAIMPKVDLGWVDQIILWHGGMGQGLGYDRPRAIAARLPLRIHRGLADDRRRRDRHLQLRRQLVA